MKKKLLLILILISIFFIGIGTYKCVDLSSNNRNNSTRGQNNTQGDVNGNQNNGYWHDQEAIKVTVYDGNGNKKAGPKYVVIKDQPGSNNSGISSKPIYSCSCGNSYSFATTSKDSSCSCSLKTYEYDYSFLNRFSGSYWGMYYSDSESIDTILKSNNHAVLIDIINTIEDPNNKYTNDDFVIVEPVVRVRCNNSTYKNVFLEGTINSLMKGNISYFNASSANTCGNSSQFMYVYSAIAQSFISSDRDDAIANYKANKSYKKTDELCIKNTETFNHKIYFVGSDYSKYSGCGYNRYNLSNIKTTCGERDGQWYGPDGEKLDPNTRDHMESLCKACNAETVPTNAIDRVKFYLRYKNSTVPKDYRNLLDFSKSGDLACSNPEPTKLTNNCLNINYNNTFNSDNVSKYNEIINVNGESAFCSISFSLNSIDNRTVWNAEKAGMAYISGNATSTFAKGVLTYKCYLYTNNPNNFVNERPLHNKEYASDIGRVKLGGKELPILSVDTNIDKANKGSNYVEYVKQFTVNYGYPITYISSITGMLPDSEGEDTIPAYGLFSKFTDNSSGIVVPFSIEFTDSFRGKVNIVEGSSCTYSTKTEEHNNLVFRTIDTNNPFLGEDGRGRKVGANWCFIKDDGTYDCNPDNPLVEEKILNANNSYNRTNGGIKYRFVLTPDVVRQIRSYNSQVKIDVFNKECRSDDNCQNTFFKTVMDNENIITTGKNLLIKW